MAVAGELDGSPETVRPGPDHDRVVALAAHPRILWHRRHYRAAYAAPLATAGVRPALRTASAARRRRLTPSRICSTLASPKLSRASFRGTSRSSETCPNSPGI